MTDQLANDVAVLVELFKSRSWNELRVEGRGISLLFSTDPAATSGDLSASAMAPAQPRAVPTPNAAPTPPTFEIPSAPAAPNASASRDPRWHAVAAPNLGTFYRSPKPGSAPFVEVGDTVKADMEICLLEVMKLFTSVKAGIAGIVREIVATDAELVEGGRPLFYIEPQGN